MIFINPLASYDSDDISDKYRCPFYIDAYYYDNNLSNVNYNSYEIVI